MKKKLFIIATVLILVLSAVTVTACNTDEKLFNAFAVFPQKSFW